MKAREGSLMSRSDAGTGFNLKKKQKKTVRLGAAVWRDVDGVRTLWQRERDLVGETI